ncbi:MAG: transposase [Chloroflexi bacterium]|nr:transposase [Chloroflexota bacterium]
MPLPIDLMEQALGQYLSLFRDSFSQPQWQHFVTVLLALMQCEEHRTLSALLRQVAGVGYRIDGLHRFFKSAPWHPEQLVARWWRHYCRTLGPVVAAEHARQRSLRPKLRGRPRKTVVTGFLIIDDSTHAKRKGKKMEGLGHHYSTIEGKPIKGHSLFAALHVLLGHRCPLAPRLYRQKTVCQQEKAKFQSKIDLAEDVMDTFVPVPNTRTHVLMDSWFTCRRLWKKALGRGGAITSGLKSNRKIRVVDPERGRVYVHLPQYAAGLTAEDYQPVPWPHEDGTSRTVYAHLIKTWVRNLGPCQVLVVRDRLDQPLKEVRYWATSEREADIATVVSWAAQRWAIETFFADVKEVFGTDQYQLRSVKGLVRFWHLAFLGYCYLEERRAALLAAGTSPDLTIGQARCHQQKCHRRLMLGWIHDQFKQGLTPDQVDELLAA